MTVAMDAAADGVINGIATAPVMVLDGQTMPAAKVQLQIGKQTATSYSDASGHYQVQMPMREGTYQVKVKAQDVRGKVETAAMTSQMGDAVLAWEATTVEVVRNDIGNVGLASRTLAMVSGAVYDAVNDVERTGSVYKFDVQAPAGASASAAAAEAAYAVLSGLDPAMLPLLEVIMAQSTAALGDGPAVRAGLQVGLEVGQDMLAWRANDGSAQDVPYTPGTAPGAWRPTPPTYEVAWGPNWGQVNTFGVTSSISNFQPPPPPALNSAAYAAAYDQVKSLGAINSKTRTPYQTQTGVFWSYDALSTGTPVVHFQEIAEEVALQRHDTMTQNARMFGLVDVAMGDAGIAAWTAKYTYNRWRPITAIQLASTDGNSATTADATWQPLGSPGGPGQPNFTPPFPSYVSGHATFGGALFSTLADFYGTDKVHFTLTSDQLPGVTRSYSSFTQASLENAGSRIDLGLHFSFDETAGMAVGTKIAQDIYANDMTVNPR